jgi:hypothetical protein
MTRADWAATCLTFDLAAQPPDVAISASFDTAQFLMRRRRARCQDGRGVPMTKARFVVHAGTALVPCDARGRDGHGMSHLRAGRASGGRGVRGPGTGTSTSAGPVARG